MLFFLTADPKVPIERKLSAWRKIPCEITWGRSLTVRIEQEPRQPRRAMPFRRRLRLAHEKFFKSESTWFLID